MNELSNGITIYVENTGKTYHTLDDWGLALGNNNYIGDPKMQTTYIQIPGRDGLLDASEVLTGRRVYTKRQIAFSLGGKRVRSNWDAVISTWRNEINGRICQVTLDTDPTYFWKGRVYIQEFDRFRELGTFSLTIPEADPYKYSHETSVEPWKWDPFNFLTGIITYIGAITVSGTKTITIPHGYMPTSPLFIVSNKVGTLTVTFDGDTYEMTSLSSKFPSIIVGGDDDVDLTFTGNATIEIVYRSGSL